MRIGTALYVSIILRFMFVINYIAVKISSSIKGL